MKKLWNAARWIGRYVGAVFAPAPPVITGSWHRRQEAFMRLAERDAREAQKRNDAN